MQSNERAYSEDPVKAIEKRFASIIRNISEIVVLIDAHATILFVSAQVEKVLGFRPVDVIGHNIFDFIHPDDVQRTAMEFSQTVQQAGEGVPSILRIRDAAGVWIPFEIIANNRIHDSDIHGVIFTARDLRFRRDIEEAISHANADIEKCVEERTTELAKANASLRLENQSRLQTENQLRQSQKMEALGRLAGGIAHDFNNLLMLISGYLSQLIDDPSLSHEQRNTCEQIGAAAKRAAAMTKQLLSFSRKSQASPAVIDLNATVLNMDRMLRRLLSDSIRLEISLSSDPLPIYADASQIELVIMNLAINARDAMPDDGLLSVVTDSEVLSSAISKGNEDPKTYAVLKVRDTGGGMTPEIQAHIFEPFFTTKEVGKGTGLGLSTAYGIVQLAGGYIEVESELNHGTEFRVYLPKTSAKPGTTMTESAQLPPGRGHETILLAEDEVGIRAMTRVYLEGLGYRVFDAADGPEAVRLSLEYQGAIDLVITDIMMPGMRGDAVVKAIRNDRPAIRILYISGRADDQLAIHASAILQKPFEFPELGRRVRLVLDSGPGSPAAL